MAQIASTTKVTANGGAQALPEALVVLVRHGDTEVNDEHRMRAWIDVDLTPRGRRDTVKTAKQLEKLPLPVVEIYCSDLSRAEQTAQILANQFFVPLSKKRELRTWNIGKYTMQKFDDVKQFLIELVRHSKQKAPGGESDSEFVRRWRSGLRDLVAAAVARKGTVIGVTHSRNIEHTRQMLLGTDDPVAHVEASTVPPSGYMTIEVRGRKLSLAPFENSHLEGSVE